MPKKLKYIFIDESGTLPDKNDSFVVVTAIATDDPRKLTDLSSSVRKSLRGSKKVPAEIKFYSSGDKTKTIFLTKLNRLDISVSVLVVSKKDSSIEDSPLNFAALCYYSIKPITSKNKLLDIELIFDKHFHRPDDRLRFNLFLERKIHNIKKIRHVDSQRERAVNCADMISGAVLCSLRKTDKFFLIIKKKIAHYKQVQWSELKRKFLSEIKNLAEPM